MITLRAVAIPSAGSPLCQVPVQCRYCLFNTCPCRDDAAPAASPLARLLELREKNERVVRDEASRFVYELKVLGESVTSEIRPISQK